MDDRSRNVQLSKVIALLQKSMVLINFKLFHKKLEMEGGANLDYRFQQDTGGKGARKRV